MVQAHADETASRCKSPGRTSTPIIPVDAFSARDEMMANYFGTPILGGTVFGPVHKAVTAYWRTCSATMPSFFARWVPALASGPSIGFSDGYGRWR